MKSLIVFAAVFCASQLAHAAPADSKVDCSKLDEMIDELGSAQGMTTMNDKYKLETTADEQLRRCAEMSDAIKMLRKYNKECYSSLTQQVLSAILRTRAAFNEARCKDPNSAEFKEGLEAVKCIAEKSLESARREELNTVLSFQVLHELNLPDDKLRTRRACCAVLDAKKYFVNGTKDKCSAYEKIYADYVDSYTSEAMGLICPDADKLECDKLEPLKIQGVANKSKFFLSPMMKLVKTLDH